MDCLRSSQAWPGKRSRKNDCPHGSPAQEEASGSPLYAPAQPGSEVNKEERFHDIPGRKDENKGIKLRVGQSE